MDSQTEMDSQARIYGVAHIITTRVIIVYIVFALLWPLFLHLLFAHVGLPRVHRIDQHICQRMKTFDSLYLNTIPYSYLISSRICCSFLNARDSYTTRAFMDGLKGTEHFARYHDSIIATTTVI
jgi:hypothetical protein